MSEKCFASTEAGHFSIPAQGGRGTETARLAFRWRMSTEPFLDAPRSVQELHRQMDVQTTTWRIQRIGWWVLLLFSLAGAARSEEHTSELQSRENLVCRLLLEKKKYE